MSNKSHQAARYGSLAESFAAERYGLELDHSAYHDAIDQDGNPWDVKAAMKSRDATRFRLWKEQHDRLRQEGGGYVFVLYSPSGRGIDVHKCRSIRATNLRMSFYGAGGHQKGKQYKIRPERIFSGG